MNLLPATVTASSVPLCATGAEHAPFDLLQPSPGGMLCGMNQPNTPFAAILSALSATDDASGDRQISSPDTTDAIPQPWETAPALAVLLAGAGTAWSAITFDSQRPPLLSPSLLGIQERDADSVLAPVQRWIETLQQMLGHLLPEVTVALDRATLHTSNGAVHFSVTLLEQTPTLPDPAGQLIEQSDRAWLAVPEVNTRGRDSAAPVHSAHVMAAHALRSALPVHPSSVVEQGASALHTRGESLQRAEVRVQPSDVASPFASGADSHASDESPSHPEHRVFDHGAVQPAEEALLRGYLARTLPELSASAENRSPLETGLRAILRATVTALWQGNQSTARIVLQPESLGTIVVHLATRGQETVVQIIVSSAETYSTVSQTVETLQADLHACGIRADAIAVRLAEPSVVERSALLPPVPSGVVAVGDDQADRRQKQRQHRQRSRSHSRDHEQFEHFM